jgi:acyl carrier protein
MTEIADRVRQIIANHFRARNIDPARVVPAARLVEDLGADSLDLVEIVFALEDQFGREIGDEETERLVAVADVIALIESAT